MSAELIGIISVGIALAGLILASRRDINVRLVSLERGQADFGERLARVEGILEGLALQRVNQTTGTE